MKDAAQSVPSDRAPAQAAPKAVKRNTMSRIKLALLEQYAATGEKKGGDPYNTISNAAVDQWRGNSRRI